MNQELKLKWHSIYGQILFDRKLTAAWKQVEDNGGCGGIDKETLESFRADEENKIMEILKGLRERTYKPTPVKRVYIPKSNGKERPLGIPTISTNCTKTQYPFGKFNHHSPISSTERAIL
jgi:RNA-directed DNA polymerase